MQITNEMVEAALDAYDAPRYATCEKRMRAALEAALGEKKEYQSENGIIFRLRKRNVPYGWIELADIAADCIEDLAGALKTFADKWANVENEREDDDSHFYMHTIMIGDLRRARATLERWGLK